MPDHSLSLEGGCRCGQVRFRITRPALLSMACHCRGCQRMTASAFSLSAAIPSDGFAVIKGEPVIGGLHGATRHFHCPHCKTWMFTRPEGMDWFVNIRSVLLDERRWTTPFVETFTREKLPWAATPAAYSFEEFPPMEAYEGMIAEFVRLPVNSVQEPGAA